MFGGMVRSKCRVNSEIIDVTTEITTLITVLITRQYFQI